jgi:hypothetical protein
MAAIEASYLFISLGDVVVGSIVSSRSNVASSDDFFNVIFVVPI